jgi:hypothetical protein
MQRNRVTVIVISMLLACSGILTHDVYHLRPLGRFYGACAGTTLMLLYGEPLISFVLTTV